jgi:hypothetical protein
MRRQLPIAQRLLADLARPGAVTIEDLAPGMTEAGLEHLLTRFVRASGPGGNPASEISAWVKVGSVLHRAART